MITEVSYQIIGYPTEILLEMDEYAGKMKLKACRHCGRTFVPESLVKHEGNCQKVQKKRKVFDTSKQRVTEDLSLKQIKQAQKKNVKPKQSHWRAKHEEFIRNIRAAKGAQVAIDRGDPLPPPPPPSENPDYITCPYCSRRFNEKAADRHIGFCKEQQLRKGKGREPTAQEKARAAAKGYQAPRPKGRGQPADSPSYGNSVGSARGGYSNSSPAAAARGGYSNASPAARGPTKPEPSRTPGSGTGYGSRGRAGPGAGAATRGRPSPSQPAYQASDYTDYESQYSDLEAGDTRYGNHGNGRILRTGRDIQSFQEAHREVRGGNPPPRNKTTNQRAGMAANRLASTKTSGPGARGADSGYYSNSDGDNPGKPMRKGPPSRFCHECGNKYPVDDARFCCECGVKRMGIVGR